MGNLGDRWPHSRVGVIAVGLLAGAGLLQALAADRGEAAFPGMSRGKIGFSSDRDGDFDIYSMNTDGSSPTPLTTRRERGSRARPIRPTASGSSSGATGRRTQRMTRST